MGSALAVSDPRFERQHPQSVCERCEGEGYVLANARIHSTKRLGLVNCPDCEGTGERKATS